MQNEKAIVEFHCKESILTYSYIFRGSSMSTPQLLEKNKKLLIIIAKFSACKKIKQRKTNF